MAKKNQAPAPVVENNDLQQNNAYRYNESMINWEQLKNFGVSREYLQERGLLDSMLKGYKTNQVEGMTAKSGNEFNAYIQVSAERRGIDFIFENDRIFNRTALGGVELSRQQIDDLNAGRAIFVENMQRKDGELFSSYVKLDEATGRPSYTRYNPDSPEGAREIYIPKEIGGVQLMEKEQKDLREGRPVTTDFINELIRGYSERHNGTPHGKIPPNLLWSDTRKGSEKYVWYNPPRKRMMFFKESLNIEDAEYNMPGIIYEIKEERMNIYAYIDKESSSYFNPMAVLYWKY